MKRFLAAVRAIGILLASWAVLLGIGVAAGVFPPKGMRLPWWPYGEPSGEPIATNDAGTGTVDAGPASASMDAGAAARANAVPPRDAGLASATTLDASTATVRSDAGAAADAPPIGAPLRVDPRVARYLACSGAVETTLGTLTIRPNEAPFLFLGCGASGEVIGFSHETGTPLRVARISVPVGAAAPPVRRLRALSADVTGDGIADWVVGTLRSAAVGAPQSGSLHLLRGDGHGSFDAPVGLAQIAVADLAVGAIDGDSILDLVALSQPDAAGRRSSEAWVFRGGASPVRSAKLAASGTANSVALLLLDGDDVLDVLIGGTGTPPLRAYFGDGSGRHSRNATIATPAVTALRQGDVDGDGFDDALIVAGALRAVRGHGADVAFEATTLAALPELRAVSVLDFDDDHDLDIVGLSPNADAILARRGPDGYSIETLVSLPRNSGRIVDVLVSNVSSSSRPDVVLLVERNADTHARDWMIVRDVETAVTPTLEAEASAVDDAPLSLSFELR